MIVHGLARFELGEFTSLEPYLVARVHLRPEVVEEGLEIELLRRVLISAGEVARSEGCPVVTGDTKVVERGSLNGLAINTSGIGEILPRAALSGTLNVRLLTPAVSATLAKIWSPGVAQLPSASKSSQAERNPLVEATTRRLTGSPPPH
jgi:hypothetical protein